MPPHGLVSSRSRPVPSGDGQESELSTSIWSYLHARTPPCSGTAPLPQMAKPILRSMATLILPTHGAAPQPTGHTSTQPAKPANSPKGPVVNLAESDYDDVQARLAGHTAAARNRLRRYPIDGVPRRTHKGGHHEISERPQACCRCCQGAEFLRRIDQGRAETRKVSVSPGATTPIRGDGLGSRSSKWAR